MANKKEKYITLIILVVSYTLLFVLNQLTYFTSDDYAYHYIYKGHMPTTNPERIHGIKTIIESQINHYSLWNGRYLAHSIVQFFLQFDKTIFNIFNSIAFLILVYFIYSIINSVSYIKKSNGLLIQIILLLWLILPSFGQTVLWVSGSGNYLWASLFYTGFLLFCIKNMDDSFFIIFCSVIIGFLSGVTNENSGPATILMVICIFILNIIIEKKVRIYQITGALSGIVGFISMMSSKGSLKRGHVDLSFEFLVTNFKDIFKISLTHFIFIYILILILILILSLSKQINFKDGIFLFILFIGHFSSIYSLIIISYKPLRVLFGSSIFLVIITAYLLNRLANIKWVQYTISLGLILLSAVTYNDAIKDISTTHTQVMEQVSILKNATPNQDVTVYMITFPTTTYNAYNETANLTDNKNAWFNQWMATYFNVKSITGKTR